VIDFEGKMTKSEFVPEKYWGMPTEKAKAVVVEDLRRAGLVKKEE
jgi:valyl-tRNA synthetase